VGVSEELKANNKPDNLNVEHEISLAAESAEANQIVPCGNDAIACQSAPSGVS